MYSSGHIEIFWEALKLLLENKKNTFLNKSIYKDVSLDNTMLGLKYPDFPCGTYKFEEGRLKMSKTLCSLTKLIDDIIVIPNIYSMSYSSHNGYFSTWHAMTYDPTKTVEETTDTVIEHIMSMFKLALLDNTLDKPGPNSFWLGFALHTIMDAYSPAHILRHNSISIDYKKLIKEVLPNFVIPISNKTNNELSILNDLKTTIHNSVDIIKSNEDLNEVIEPITYNIKKKSVQKDISSLARFFLFHEKELKSIQDLHSIVAKTLSVKIGTDPFDDKVYKKLHSKNKKYIMNYYYYPVQSAFYHKKNDMIYSVKNNNLFDACVLDCYMVLKIYKEALEMLNNSEKNIDKLSIVYAYLRKIYKYLTLVTFKIHHNCKKFKTGVDIEKIGI